MALSQSFLGLSVMDELTAAGFLEVSRALSAVAAELGMQAPSFRCPPRTPGADRTVRRWTGGGAVAVRRRERPAATVVEDMVEGVVVVTGLPPEPAAAARSRLRAAAWAALGEAPVLTLVAPAPAPAATPMVAIADGRDRAA
jgi:hypothetical protein